MKKGDYFRVLKTTYLYSIPGDEDCGWVGLVWDDHYGYIIGDDGEEFYYVKMLKSENPHKYGAIDKKCVMKISKDKLMIEEL